MLGNKCWESVEVGGGAGVQAYSELSSVQKNTKQVAKNGENIE